MGSNSSLGKYGPQIRSSANPLGAFMYYNTGLYDKLQQRQQNPYYQQAQPAQSPAQTQVPTQTTTPAQTPDPRKFINPSWGRGGL